MRPRTEAALAMGGLTLLAVVMGLLARPRGARGGEDPRPSSFLAGPHGARGLLEALRALGLEVRRFRERPRELPRLGSPGRQALVVLDPTHPFSPPERASLLAFHARADLVLAGKGAESLLRCFGYRVRERRFDSVQVAEPGRTPGARAPWVQAALEATHEREHRDSTRLFDVGPSLCVVPPVAALDTLLLSSRRELVALRLRPAGADRSVLLVADAGLFANRTLRDTWAGPLVLRWFLGRHERVVFEEYHHGFGAQGSLAGAALAWSRRSPWGWAAWQAALVGVLALLFGAVRFGPVRPGIRRTRRSPLEHVRALAVALSAARGPDEALGARVRGLRRRLAPPELRSRTEWRAWLAGLQRPGTTAAVRASLASLSSLTRPRQPASSVLAAADAVEDLWQDLKP